jgi:endonuclease YncB( thermonuclease family)
VNQELIHDGHAYADRRSTDALAALFATAESDARKHQRGLWQSVTFDRFPAWRQAWTRSLRAASAATEP